MANEGGFCGATWLPVLVTQPNVLGLKGSVLLGVLERLTSSIGLLFFDEKTRSVTCVIKVVNHGVDLFLQGSISHK